MNQPTVEMPKYKCHKEVWALKIKGILNCPPDARDCSRSLDFEDDGYAPINVSDEYMAKHDPKVGGYYVVYEDGYTSYSPAKAFEDGYTRINLGILDSQGSPK